MNTLYVISPPADIFKGLHTDDSHRIVTLPDFLRYPADRIKGLTRSLVMGRIPVPRPLLYYWLDRKYLDELRRARPGDSVLIYECSNLRTLRVVKQQLSPQVKCYIYYCNPIHLLFRNPLRQIREIERMGYTVTTFDESDARNYRIKCTGQYFCFPSHREQTTAYDCFFCGLPKDRMQELRQLQHLLEQEKLKCRFVIPHREEEKISYTDYLNILARSRCVIDIAQKKQTGLTRRPLEALFYRKKLISNNPCLKHYDFYNPDNIFIFGHDSADRLKAFIEAPWTEIADEIVRKYDVNEWIKNYLPY